LPTDARTVQAYVRKVEELGYEHVEIYDHVLGADPAAHPGWTGAYDVDTTFHESLVFYGFLAAITPRMELVTGIIVAPQRQTALLAKQAAEVDILSEGHFRLGIAAGWNPVEYEALIQRPIPIWLGGASRAAYRRMGRLADGWFPRVEPGPDLDEARHAIATAAAEAGRDPASIGMDGRIRQGAGATNDLVRNAQRWREAGATHVSVDTMRSELAGLEAHLGALATAAEALRLGSALHDRPTGDRETPLSDRELGAPRREPAD
jgi:alkanesulfonate monooxygenase SsuD/methylene tetrahydromethanopterin reductase-like flavin-dependent oxidoreductase (luciferase family)